MAGGGGGGGRSLEQTPTWAVAIVCFVLVLISILMEHSIHLVGKWLMRNHKRALYEALEKLKSELMLLGFISLLLTVGQGPISEICISPRLGNSMLPCRKRPTSSYDTKEGEKYEAVADNKEFSDEIIGRKLLWSQNPGPDFRRILAAGGGGGADKCAPKGKVPLVSAQGINQLHIFIFVLAVFHVLYCITTMALGRAKMKTWKVSEEECKTTEYQFAHDPERFRFTRETTFGRRHLHFWSRTPVLIWIVCFFRQFVRSVPKVDYLTLRHGFIMAHLAPHSSVKFDFQQYIKRSLEDDFKVVVGISPTIWFVAVLFQIFYTHGWYSYFWFPFIPLLIILLVGTKLQVVITRMGLEIQGKDDIVRGIPTVRPADHLFWFNRPHLILYLIHFALFQNAFQLAFFVWAWYQFGLRSCFHEHTADIIIRASMGLLIQFLCSYVTLPLYALVSHMGSNMRSTIFNERVAGRLRRWHNTAKKHLKEAKKPGCPSPMSSRPTRPRSAGNPAVSPYPLRKYDWNEANRSASPSHHTHDEGSSSHHTHDEGSSSHHHRHQEIPHNRQHESPRAKDIEAQEGGPSDLKAKQFAK